MLKSQFCFKFITQLPRKFFLWSRKIKFARPSINDKGAWGQYCKSTFFRSTVNSVPKMFAEIYVGAMQLNVDSVASGAV